MHEPKHKSSSYKSTYYDDVIDQEGLFFPAVEATTEVVPDNCHSQAWNQVIRFDI
jgi:hypothetical protein